VQALFSDCHIPLINFGISDNDFDGPDRLRYVLFDKRPHGQDTVLQLVEGGFQMT